MRLWAAVLLLAGAAAVVLLARDHPSDITVIPPCPTWRLLGFYCPGCGTMRAIHFTLNARLADAWQHNPALLVIGIPAAVAAAVWCLATLFGCRVRVLVLPAWFGWTIVAALVLFTITRNLPYPIAESIRPPDSLVDTNN